MAAEQLDPDCIRKLMDDPDVQANALNALERAAAAYLPTLPDAEGSFGPGTRLATDLDYWLDETGIRPEGHELPS